jgi:PhnB protein
MGKSKFTSVFSHERPEISTQEDDRFARTVLHSPSAIQALACANFNEDPSMSAQPTFVPYLVVSNAAAAIDFYKKAFGAQELSRHAAPGTDKLMHAALVINGGNLFLADDFCEQMNQKSETPEALGGSPVTFHLHVEDADAAWAQAVAAGAEVTMPLADQFWGDRYGQLRDPFGHKWSIGQTKVALSKEDIEQNAKEAFVN